ncbi:GNAT family N-acetyltransferase [Prosthecomicrobium hirschii]|uniref:GNAT family N-acetyltransferase n=1 Tax=Prosthecodimorpha hirschii TaxID=665126 RepID=UPI00221E60AE|nr:GNAT family N-acetyltransferase [Prosthecomicrobium hirschii]MCW1839499.1 GNAT family N-acetyltransferase [Prosthecomicrobium hirschii]
MTADAISILPTAPEHRAAWDDLYAGYADFYRVSQTPAMRDTVWSWLMDPAHQVEGLVAVDAAGRPVGIAHFRAFARPLSASTGGFLDDLFVSEAARGSGAADALIGRIAEIGRARGWSVIRWITAEDNARARKVYDRMAMKTRWVTYDLAL